MNPVLKVKAAEARAMVPVVHYITQHMFPKNTAYQRLRFNMLSKLLRCYELLKDFDAIEMGSSARRFHMLYNELSAMAMRNNQPHRWKLYPKFHLMIHLAESGENPSLSWNYMDESAIGECAQHAEHCNVRFLHRSLILQYCLFKFD